MHPVLPPTLEEAQAVIARQQQELAQLQGAHEATMLSQEEPPPLERGITWSKVRSFDVPL